MYPTQHAAAALGVVVPLLGRRWPRSALAVFAASAVLIDVDHYVSYVWATGDLSLPNAYHYHCGRAVRSRWGLRLRWPVQVAEPHRPFHTLAVLSCLVLAARRWPHLWPVAWGALFHRLQDWCWDCTRLPLREPAPAG